MERQVSVIIPVYNAFQESLACIKSVLENSPAECRVLVIDDCSPNGNFLDTLPARFRGDPRLSVVRNDHNLGFVGTCNRGMLELSGSDDIILLNSDTEVTPRWMEKLSRAAYSKSNIGTVTPLTNNGAICSIPNFGVDNALIPGMSLKEIGALAESASICEYPVLPTCVGFCTFIRRNVVDKLKGFDAKAFGKGYGEENDLSCRAQKKGFIDILDDATFIYHKGNMSFGSMREELAHKNSATLRRRHPLYFDNVQIFCRSFPLRGVHNRILDELLKRETKAKAQNVLHVVHSGPYLARHHEVGGTERHVQDIIAGVPEVVHWSLTPTPSAFFLTAHLGYADREFILDPATTTLYDIFKPEFFDLIHVQHIMGFKYGELDAALRQHGNYIVSLHDFNLICPRLYLLTTERKHCTGFECTTACSFGEYYISEYRKLASAMLGAAKSVICFSESTKNYFERILKQSFRWKVQPHGILGLKEVRGEGLSAKRPSKEDPLRAVFLGFLPAHKGTAIIEELVTENILPDGTPVEWHVVGELFGKAPATVHQHGKYDRETLPEKFKEINPHVVIILSICPETYSLTLDEAWNTGVPVISTPLGAPGERVAKTGAGWVLPELSAHAVRSQLASIASNWDDYLSRREKVKSVPLIDTRTEGAVYRAFYAEAAPQKRARVEAIFERFAAVSLTKLPEPRLSHRILRRLLNRGIRLLERLRLRVLAERVLYGILPNKFMQDLKSLR